MNCGIMKRCMIVDDYNLSKLDIVYLRNHSGTNYSLNGKICLFGNRAEKQPAGRNHYSGGKPSLKAQTWGNFPGLEILCLAEVPPHPCLALLADVFSLCYFWGTTYHKKFKRRDDWLSFWGSNRLGLSWWTCPPATHQCLSLISLMPHFAGWRMQAWPA